jgi:hypothetical protein
MFDMLITPTAGWQPPRSTPAPQPSALGRVRKPGHRDWEDAAGDGDWQEAIISYLVSGRKLLFSEVARDVEGGREPVSG